MTQTKLPGYRTLTADQLALMKDNKLLEEIVQRQIDRHVRTHGDPTLDQRWVAIARTHIHEGFMALSRAVAQPERLNPTTETIEGFAADIERLVEGLIRAH